ncbi:MAG: glycosyltransferase family 4 protein [Bacteroidales bacterium]|jgi:glycosyltransferase involved in cell wall biosynthesis|nr:glycosyltransferase family 4 protein [Bacteroidales bacterium]
MKILVISNYSNYHTVRPEAEIFIALAQRGVDVHIMTKQESEYTRLFREAGINVSFSHPVKRADKEEIAVIRNYIIEHNIDILQLFNNNGIRAGIPAAKGLPVKVVLYRGYTGNLNKLNPASYLKHLHPRVDAIICNSIGVKNYLDKQLPKLANKTVAINKGHRLEWYADVKAYDIRAELGIPADSFVFVNTANNRTMKGIPYLLQAVHSLSPDMNCHLIIIGEGMDTPQNKQIIQRGKNTEKIHLLGHRTNALEIVKASDVFVLSSIKGESITKSVIESMSLGVPSIITDIPGNVELVEHEKSGLVVKRKNFKALAEAMTRVYTDRDLCAQLAQHAPRHIEENLNADNTAQEYYDLYAQLVQQ